MRVGKVHVQMYISQLQVSMTMETELRVIIPAMDLRTLMVCLDTDITPVLVLVAVCLRLSYRLWKRVEVTVSMGYSLISHIQR